MKIFIQNQRQAMPVNEALGGIEEAFKGLHEGSSEVTVVGHDLTRYFFWGWLPDKRPFCVLVVDPAADWNVEKLTNRLHEIQDEFARQFVFYVFFPVCSKKSRSYVDMDIPREGLRKVIFFEYECLKGPSEPVLLIREMKRRRKDVLNQTVAATTLSNQSEELKDNKNWMSLFYTASRLNEDELEEFMNLGLELRKEFATPRPL